VASLVTAVHAAVAGAGATQAIRRAYGVPREGTALDAPGTRAAAGKILQRAAAEPAEALSLGILAADVASLDQAMKALTAAAPEAGPPRRPTLAQKRTAAARMHAMVARIAGAGVLAFAGEPETRTAFAALTRKTEPG
jgi:hypothetical protein